MGLLDFFSHDAGQARREWLDGQSRGLLDELRYYAGPYAPNLGLLAEMNPVNDIGQAMADSRDGDYIGALTNTAAAMAPLAAGRVAKAYNPRMADDAAQWLQDALTGISVNPTRAGVDNAARAFVGDEAGAINLDALRGKYPGAKIDVGGNADRGYTINRIVVPEAERGSGLGTDIMNDILRGADDDGATLALTPSADFGGNKRRLHEFYERFGFIENKGRNKDFEISEAMYRPAHAPQLTPAQQQAQDILDLLSQGRASEVTDDMMAAADDMYLYNNYDLPMDEASRMARAKEMGFDEDALHGTVTGAQFDAFRGPNKYGDWRETYVAPNSSDGQKLVAQFSSGDQGRVFPLRVKGGDVLDTNTVEGRERFLDILDGKNLRLDWDLGHNGGGFRASGRPGWGNQTVIDAVGKENPAGMKIHERDWVESTAVFDPTNIRSRFARFDPRLKHLANLSAGVGGMGLLGLYGMTPEELEARYGY